MNSFRLCGATLLSVLLGVGCGASPSEQSRSAGNSVGADGTAKALERAAEGDTSCTPPPLEKIRAERRAAVRHFVAGAHRDAVGEFSALVRSHPEDLASQALLLAAKQRQAAAAALSVDGLEAKSRIRLEAPRGPTRVVRALGGITPKEAKLERISETKNQITDDQRWYDKHQVTPRELAVSRARAEELPDGAPPQLARQRAQRLFQHADHAIIAYQQTLLLLPNSGEAQLFDASGLHEITDAQLVGDALIVSSWRNGYAKDVGNETGFISAHDLETGTLRWQSDALVTSMGGFLVTSSHIISGYGFTAEPDHLFLLDLRSGKTLQKSALSSGPSVIIARGDRVLLRTYDTDVEFRLSPGFDSAPPARSFGQAKNPEATADQQVVCRVENAVRAVDARDEAALLATITELKETRGQLELAQSFEGVLGFLAQQRGPQPGIDLWQRPPLRLQAPPWERTLVRAAGEPVTGQARLVSKPAVPSKPRPGRGGRAPFRADSASFIPPVDNGRLPAGARADIPTSYGLESLRAIIPDGKRLVLIYGGRYLAVIDESRTEALLDLETFRHPPGVSAQNAEFAIADVTYAVVQGNAVFVANGGGSYAKEMGGKKGFVSALDLTSGELLWRSEPLVMGPGSFGVWQDFLVTGYGFTAEPDNAFLLRRDTGAVAHKAALRSAPNSIVVRGDSAEFRTYDGQQTLELQRISR